MKKPNLNYILNISMIYLLLYNIRIIFVYSSDYSNCNKLWGVTQDANGKMLYKVGMYMCVEDPYNIYKNSYSSMPPPLLNVNSLPIPLNKTNISIGGNITTISPNITKNNFNHSINYTKLRNISGILNNSHHSTTTAISPTTITTTLSPTTTTTTTLSPTTITTTTLSPTTTTTLSPITTTLSPTTFKNYTSNQSNQSNQYTNLRSTNGGTTENTTDNSPDIVLIIVIIVIVVILKVLICLVVYHKCKTKKITNENVKVETVEKEITKATTTKINVKPNNLLVDTSNKGKELKLNHDALTPNTRKILNESETSVKNWYKKTFKNELKDCNDVPMPPVSKVYPLTNNKQDKPNISLKKNVKKLINVHEMKIKNAQQYHRKVPTNHYDRQHNISNNTSNRPNYQIQYLNNNSNNKQSHHHTNSNFAK